MLSLQACTRDFLPSFLSWNRTIQPLKSPRMQMRPPKLHAMLAFPSRRAETKGIICENRPCCRSNSYSELLNAVCPSVLYSSHPSLLETLAQSLLPFLLFMLVVCSIFWLVLVSSHGSRSASRLTFVFFLVLCMCKTCCCPFDLSLYRPLCA